MRRAPEAVHRLFGLLVLVVMLLMVIGGAGKQSTGKPSQPRLTARATGGRRSAAEPEQPASGTIDALHFVKDLSMSMAERATGVVVDSDGRPIFGALLRHPLIEDVIMVNGREGVLLGPPAIATARGAVVHESGHQDER